MNITANDFYIKIKERSFPVWGICFVQTEVPLDIYQEYVTSHHFLWQMNFPAQYQEIWSCTVLVGECFCRHLLKGVHVHPNSPVTDSTNISLFEAAFYCTILKVRVMKGVTLLCVFWNLLHRVTIKSIWSSSYTQMLAITSLTRTSPVESAFWYSSG